jgi:glycosyltransferase involved in cell wall biosynthesis
MPIVPVSVVIPALNAELFVAEAIESVHAQTVAVAEIIVVDNGSVDKTQEIARSLGAKVLKRNDRSGPGAARNKGIENSDQDWIALLDADDRWKPRKLEEQWSAVERFPEAGIISCHGLVFENDSILLEESSQDMKQRWQDYPGDCTVVDHCRYLPKIDKSFLPRFQPSPSETLIRREVFAVVGLFDEAMEYCEDLEFFLRVLARYPMVIIEKTLVEHRRHAGKMSFHFEKMRSYLFAVVNKMLQHPEKYPPGAGEFYRDVLKKNFFLAEKTLSNRSGP